MRIFKLSFIVLILTTVFAEAKPALVCDRQKIQQAIRFARSSKEITRLKSLPHTPGTFLASARLTAIFRDLEMKTFGQQFSHIEDFPAWPGLTWNDANVLQFSSITDKSLQEKLENPDLGAAFSIAHEFGHIVQNLRSPHKLQKVSSLTDAQGSFIYHSETDCIGVEIMFQAGYPLTKDISQTLEVIAEECKAEQVGTFCDEADKFRQYAVSAYIKKILKTKRTETK